MSKYVSFEISKLLKEKDFNEPCDDYYTSKGMLNSDGYGDIIFDQGFNSGEPERMLKFDYSDFDKKQKEDYFLCPTISDVVDWLLEKYGIWISVDRHFDKFISKNNGVIIDFDGEKRNYFETPTEAYLSAIEYALKHLI